MADTTLLKLNATDRAALVAYAKARKMPKLMVKGFESGAEDDTPLAQLVAGVRLNAEAAASKAQQKLRNDVADAAAELTQVKATAEAQVNTITTLKQDAAASLGKYTALRTAVCRARNLLGGWWVSGSKVRAILDDGLNAG